MEIVFLTESITIDSWDKSQVRVVVDVDPAKLLEDLDVEVRVKGLDHHEVITAMGINQALNALSEEELATWINSDDCDPTDLLNAIGEEFILEWLADAGPEDCNY